jgi:hypothetical protein
METSIITKQEKFESQPSAGKLMITVFLGITRPSTGTLSGGGTTINGAHTVICLLTG